MTATTQEALAARRELLGNTHLRVARTLDALARVIHERNRAADALPARGRSAEDPPQCQRRSEL